MVYSEIYFIIVVLPQLTALHVIVVLPQLTALHVLGVYRNSENRELKIVTKIILKMGHLVLQCSNASKRCRWNGN